MNNAVTILDGGMGRELKRMGAPFKQPEWSALALMEAPQTVQQAHAAFIKAGAEVITTNTYAVVPYHIGEERFKTSGAQLIKLAAELAQEAAQRASKPIQIAGCIPPLFGSYEPGNFMIERAAELVEPFIEQQKATIDFWLVETISSLVEAKTVFEALRVTGKPVWLSFHVAETEGENGPAFLKSGESIEDVIKAFIQKQDPPQAILFNCTTPERVTQAITQTASIIKTQDKEILFGGYANSFIPKQSLRAANEDVSELNQELTPQVYLDYAKKWKALGAKIIGGCCGVGPEHISVLSKNLK
ncbi:MAG: homocysteine S-methyltransferase family protein [Alphaproteobacteria bacterium]